MLDQQHRHALDIAHPADLAFQRMHLFVVQAGGRFVQQQQLWFGGQRTGELHALANRKRQAVGDAIGEGGKFMNSIRSMAFFRTAFSSRPTAGNRNAFSTKPALVRL